MFCYLQVGVSERDRNTRAKRNDTPMYGNAAPTEFFGCAGKGPLHGPAVRVIPAADAALIVNLIGADFPVATHFLQKEERENKPKRRCCSWWSLARCSSRSRPALGSCHSPHILHGHRCCRRLCRNSGSRHAPAASSKRRRQFLWTGSRGGTSCWLCSKEREVTV